MTAHRGSLRGLDAGVTLVEMLVALAIVAMAFALLTPLVRVKPATVDLIVVARLTGAKLIEARARAIGRAQVVHVDIDPIARRIAATGDATALVLPFDIDVTVTSARALVTAFRSARITFNPDGGSTGGTVSLGRAGKRVDLTVAWLTGQVEIGALP